MALSFLDSNAVDTLQLVDSGLNSFVEEHRDRKHALSRHALRIIYDGSDCATGRLRIAPRFPSNRVLYFLKGSHSSFVDDREEIARVLDARWVCCVYHLCIHGDLHPHWPVLAHRLVSERISVYHMEVSSATPYARISEQHLPVLQLASQLNVDWLEWVGLEKENAFLEHSSLYSHIPRLHYRSPRHTFTESTALGLLFDTPHRQRFPGRVVYQVFCPEGNTPRPPPTTHASGRRVPRGRAYAGLVLPPVLGIPQFVKRVIKIYSDMRPHPKHAREWLTPGESPYGLSDRPQEKGRELPADFLIVQDGLSGLEKLNAVWTMVLGEPDEANHTHQWQVEDTVANNFYWRLEGCVWAVWRVRNPHITGKQLRVMQRVGSGSDQRCRLGLAVHLQVVRDG